MLLVDPNAIKADKDVQLQLEQLKLPPGSRLKKQVASGELARRIGVQSAMTAQQMETQERARLFAFGDDEDDSTENILRDLRQTGP
mmetsp:Transcript_99907/g.177831  ORF Transcript_99907/g.177831 Transcript_99907/m.177831 type:complete len:86 (+) Transcript_99907:59-316(+)